MGFLSSALLPTVAGALTVPVVLALAADPPSPPPDVHLGQGDVVTLPALDVIAKRLDVARQQIQPSLGASTYYFSPEALQAIPQGENAPLNQVLLQAPGVVQDSFGQIHL